MRAVAVTSFGESPRLLDLPDPQPGPGEILVAVQFASINPVDWAASTGALTGLTKSRFPLVLGSAAIPTSGMTAYGALELLDLRPGQTLLIVGATGGVGVLATQLAG